MGKNHYSSSPVKFVEILICYIIMHYKLQYALKFSSRSLGQKLRCLLIQGKLFAYSYVA